MNRRGFLGLLAGVPFLGAVLGAKSEPRQKKAPKTWKWKEVRAVVEKYVIPKIQDQCPELTTVRFLLPLEQDVCLWRLVGQVGEGMYFVHLSVTRQELDRCQGVQDVIHMLEYKEFCAVQLWKEVKARAGGRIVLCRES